MNSISVQKKYNLSKDDIEVLTKYPKLFLNSNKFMIEFILENNILYYLTKCKPIIVGVYELYDFRLKNIANIGNIKSHGKFGEPRSIIIINGILRDITYIDGDNYIGLDILNGSNLLRFKRTVIDLDQNKIFGDELTIFNKFLNYFARGDIHKSSYEEIHRILEENSLISNP